MTTNIYIFYQKIAVFTGVMLRVVAVGLLLWLLYAIRDVVWLFLLSIVIAAALKELSAKPGDQLRKDRRQRYLNIGRQL